ncbi:hypothetical protein MTO96_028254 [Rhipicephalus appendiculatus]
MLLQDYCRHSELVYFLDHGFYELPPTRALAADGLHLSFEGTAILASPLRQLFVTRFSDAVSSWRTCVPATYRAPAEENSVRRNEAAAGFDT